MPTGGAPGRLGGPCLMGKLDARNGVEIAMCAYEIRRGNQADR